MDLWPALFGDNQIGDYILSRIGEGFLLIAADGRILKANTESLRILGRTSEELLGKSHWDLLPAHVGRHISAASSTLGATKPVAAIEVAFSLPEIGERWWELRISSLDEQGLAVFFRNVTNERRSALALQQSEEHLRALFEQTAAGIAERDLQGRLIRVNERFCEILGRPREQVLGVDIHDLTHADDLERSEAAFNRLLIDGRPFDIEKRYLHADGTAVWVNTTVSLIRKAGSNSTDSILAVVLDINERKKAEEALLFETRILELLNQSGQSLAATLDLNTLLQMVTDTGRALTSAEFGAFFYNGKDESGDAFLLYTLSGAPREAFDRFGHPRATALFKPTF